MAGSDFYDCNSDSSSGCGHENATSCSGKYHVRILDAPLIGAEYDPVRIDVRTVLTNSDDTTTTEADCTAGSGRFFLLPFLRGNNDDDTLRHVTFVPVQRTGTGVMTKRAWVTSITPVTAPSGATLRVVKTTAPFQFSGADMLQNASTISTAITAQTSFDTGVLRGDPPFVAEEIAEADVDGFEVDMTWSCGTAGTTVTRPQGYQFRLSDIGCTGNQKLTLRYATSPKRVYLEQYGNPTVAKVEPTATTTDGEAFVFEQGGLYIDGAVVSTSAQQAVVKLYEITWHGVSKCTPGTYTLLPE